MIFSQQRIETFMGYNRNKHYWTPYLITLFFVLLALLNPPIFDDYRFKVRNLIHREDRGTES